MKKGHLGAIIAECFRRFGTTITSEILDKVKELGYQYSTKAGITISVSDVTVPEEKQDILAKADAEVQKVLKQYRRGLITDDERYERVISIWSQAKDQITDVLMNKWANLIPFI